MSSSTSSSSNSRSAEEREQLRPSFIKKPRLAVEDVGTRDFLPELGKGGLTSDAQVLKESIKASQFMHQPVNVWYGAQDKDETDTLSDVTAKSLKHSLQATRGKQTRSCVKRNCVKTTQVEDNSEEATDHDILQPLTSLTGKNTTVAILDSGINLHHTAFGNSVKISQNSRSFVGGDVSDSLGHGTQCAGLLCGYPEVIQSDNSDLVSFQGIAPDAQVMACKVVAEGTGVASIQAVCEAIDHILQYNRQCAQRGLDNKVNVISMSFGMQGFDSNLTRKIHEAVYEDIIVICAASNSGHNGHQPITYPARLGHVLCIGACTDGGKPTDFCPVGRELDFLAPGKGIWAPSVGGDKSYCIVSGTSFAAPLVAGIVCQLLEDVRRLSDEIVGDGPTLLQRVHNVWCVRELLKEMAVVRGKHSDKSGFGKLEPLQYFEKEDAEKLRIIQKILEC